MTWYVYALNDPTTGERKYVGKSINPAKRMASHRSESAAKSVREWLLSLPADPLLEILGEYANETEALIAEQEWIGRSRAEGRKLLNAFILGPDRRRPPPRRLFSGFGTRVIERRKALGMNQLALSRASGVDQGTLARIENDPKRGCTAARAVLIARALGVTVEWLVTGELAARAA